MKNIKFSRIAALCSALWVVSPLVQAADFADDFESGMLDPSRFQLQVSEGALEAGQIRLSASSDSGQWANGSLRLAEYSDYVEGELTLLSGASLPDGRSEVAARIEMVAYNATAEGGTDGRLDDVQVQLALQVDGRGQRVARYCMWRSLNADNTTNTAVMDNNEQCRDMPLLVEYDRPYRAAIAVDRLSQTVTFRVDGLTQVINVTTAMLTASSPFAQLDVMANRQGAAQVLVDNVRTNATALTNSEIAAGLTVVPSFPVAPDATSLLADSTIENPHDFLSPVSFVDDFGDLHSTALGYSDYSDGSEPAQSAIRYVDGALQLALHSPNNEYGGANIYVHDYNSDRLDARLSLSSESALPVDGDARARMMITAYLFNDSFETADSRDGDMQFSLGLEQRGNGRVSFAYWANRRLADGSRDSLNLGSVTGFDAFDALQPTLDTPYDMAIELDRARQVLVMSVDDTVVEYPLTNIFAPYRGELYIQAEHRGSSGRAIGRVHHLSTADLEIDFSSTAPVIAPLDPHWDARFADSSIEWVDERLTLTVDSAQEGRGRASVSTRHSNDFFGADLEMSSTSEPEVGEVNTFGVGATLFNDTQPNTSADNAEQAGDSFASVSLVDSGDEAPYATYCYWRFDGDTWVEQFSGSTEVCDNRFSTPVVYDMSYAASVELDRDSKQLVWLLSGEEQNYAFNAEIHDTNSSYYRVRLAAGGEGSAVGHVDNLRFGREAPALADSPDRLLIDVSDDSGNGEAGSGSSATGGGGGPLHPLTLLLIAAAFFGRPQRRFSARLDRRAVVGAGLVVAALSGCATTPEYASALEELEPMEKLDYAEPVRLHVYDSAKSEDGVFEYRQLPSGLISAQYNDDCRWTEEDVFQPSIDWEGCPNPNSNWRSGRSDNLKVTGEPWPLVVGNKFSYRFTSVDANNKSHGSQTRRCKVLAPVHLKSPLGDMDAYPVQCQDTGEGSWWTKRTWYLNPVFGQVKFHKTHSSRGLEADWEATRIEAL